jgi:hypothetical protein
VLITPKSGFGQDWVPETKTYGANQTSDRRQAGDAHETKWEGGEGSCDSEQGRHTCSHLPPSTRSTWKWKSSFHSGSRQLLITRVLSLPWKGTGCSGRQGVSAGHGEGRTGWCVDSDHSSLLRPLALLTTHERPKHLSLSITPPAHSYLAIQRERHIRVT